MDQQMVVCLYDGYHLMNEWASDIVNNMDDPALSERSQLKRSTYCMIPFI